MPGYYVQDEPNHPVAIHLSIETLQKIGREVMTGFGRVPRRGAEIGGVLLGNVEAGSRPVIHIEDFTPVTIEYRFGPAYLLSEADENQFAEKVVEAARGELRPVGFVRSNTRDEDTLTAEDVTLLERHFLERPFTILLVRPYATRPCRACFYTCAEGPFCLDLARGPDFPFRKRDLNTVPAAAAAAAAASGDVAVAHVDTTDVSSPPAMVPESQPEVMSDPEPAAPEPAATTRPRSAWTWFPLSFIFLLLGILLGFEAAGAYRNDPPPPDPYNLRLAVTKSGNNLTVKWDHRAPAVKAAQRGSLLIADGSQQRTVDLGVTELTSGSVVYAPSSPLVHFRLDVYPKDDASISQTAEWKQ